MVKMWTSWRSLTLRLEAQDMKKVKKKKMRIQTIPLNLEIEMTKTMVMMEEKVMEVAEAMTTTMWPMDIVDALMAALVALVEVVNTLEESLAAVVVAAVDEIRFVG
jgi:predicted RNase H-like nuclease